ncbi:upstream activation factor subunit spp27 [Quercus suber]|uniref:Upstream activation factor subunit spp27 n=1 Tax=Quercus suber TaxID=58331 RepID=A0AAW0J9H1_QUESU
MVSDSDLVNRLREILRSSDLDTATAGSIRRQLEKDFGVDLSDRKTFVRDQIDIFLETLPPKQEQEEEEEEEVDIVKWVWKSNKVDKEVKKRGGGFNKLCSLSPKLQEFVGEPELARTQVVKKVWAYIRENNLQDPKNRRNIRCDESLHTLFRVKTINMFQMNKALSKHIWPLENGDVKQKVVKKLWAYIRENNLQDPKNRQNILCDESLRAIFRVDCINMFQMNKALTKHIWPLNVEDGVLDDSLQKEKQCKQEEEDEEEDSDDPNRRGKRQKKGSSGLLACLPLSDALVKFLGTGENSLSRAGAVKRMWEYIKQNDLQDPSDKRRILCDDKLKELFGVDSFNGFTVSKLLTTHFIKTEQ